jgi:hypothetical protein
MPAVTAQIGEGATPETLIHALSGSLGMRLHGEKQVRFSCRCTIERVEVALLSLGRDDPRSACRRATGNRGDLRVLRAPLRPQQRRRPAPRRAARCEHRRVGSLLRQHANEPANAEREHDGRCLRPRRVGDRDHAIDLDAAARDQSLRLTPALGEAAAGTRRSAELRYASRHGSSGMLARAVSRRWTVASKWSRAARRSVASGNDKARRCPRPRDRFFGLDRVVTDAGGAGPARSASTCRGRAERGELRVAGHHARRGYAHELAELLASPARSGRRSFRATFDIRSDAVECLPRSASSCRFAAAARRAPDIRALRRKLK